SNALYHRRRAPVGEALPTPGVEVSRPKRTIYVWAPVPPGFDSAAAYCEHVLEQAGVVISPGGAYGPNGEGFFRISLTTPDDRLVEAVNRLHQLAPVGKRRRRARWRPWPADRPAATIFIGARLRSRGAERGR